MRHLARALSPATLAGPTTLAVTAAAVALSYSSRAPRSAGTSTE